VRIFLIPSTASTYSEKASMGQLMGCPWGEKPTNTLINAQPICSIKQVNGQLYRHLVGSGLFPVIWLRNAKKDSESWHSHV